MTDVTSPSSPGLGEQPLGPLDGRYRAYVAPLAQYLSEAALNRERLRVEVAWLVHLGARHAVPGLRPLTHDEIGHLGGVVDGFDAEAVEELAAIERTTRHDVKAVEYYLKRALEGTSLADVAEYVHVFSTSEDVNNLAYALMVRGAVREVCLPAASTLVADLDAMAAGLADQPMLARTHGQAPTPTTLGKELAVLAHRLRRQLFRIEHAEYLGKANGATGTYAAHVVAAPSTDWVAVTRGFVEGLGLTWNPLTTQIESHDWQAGGSPHNPRLHRVL